MIVQSGNDATIALAERIAGTEETFAQMMNANAKRLNMVGSHFENSSGLPSPQHYTTARDLSLLVDLKFALHRLRLFRHPRQRRR